MNYNKLSLLLEEIGKLTRYGEYTFKVYSKEGTIPHIHFYKGDEEHPEEKGCVALKEVGYANHGKYKDTLPRNAWRYICRWLSIPENYINTVEQWNIANRFLVYNPYDSNKKLNNPYYDFIKRKESEQNSH